MMVKTNYEVQSGGARETVVEATDKVWWSFVTLMQTLTRLCFYEHRATHDEIRPTVHAQAHGTPRQIHQ